jgi:YidC/Oxa1 family membrane protein insertase
MQKNKNFILFLFLSFLILVTSMWLQYKLFPPPARPEKKAAPAPAAELPNNPGVWSDLQARTAAMVLSAAVPGGANGFVAAADVAVALHAGEERRALLAKKPEPKPIPPKQAPAVLVKHTKPSLGDDTSHLKVRLTSRGAAVLSVVLNRFQKADARGKPVWRQADGKKVPEPLELVPELQNLELPSNLLLHYNPNKDNDDRPLPELGTIDWELVEEVAGDDKESWRVVFRTDALPDVTLTKTYTLRRGDYHLGLDVNIKRKNNPARTTPLKFRYQLASAHGLPVEGTWYTQIFRNALVGSEDPKGALWRELQDLSQISKKAGGDAVASSGGRFIRYAGVAVQFFASLVVVDTNQPEGNGAGKNSQSFVDHARPTLEYASLRGQVRSNDIQKNEFVLSADDHIDYKFRLADGVDLPRQGSSVQVIWTSDTSDRMIATQILGGEHLHDLVPDDIAVRVVTEPIQLDKPGDEVTHRYLLYNGPIKVRLLGQFSGAASVDDKLREHYEYDLHLDTLTDYGRYGVWSDLLIKCTNIMHWILGKLNTVIGNYGLCIILLTFLVRGAMHPISRRQAQTSLRMQQMAPEIAKLKEKYKGDRQALGMAQMELYRKHGVNPMGGCLVVALQMPIFLGLYYALGESIHFRLTGFLWIDNLAAPDMLVWWSEKIPWISTPESHGSMLYLGPYFNLLPVIAVAFMIVQQSMLTPPPADEQQAMQYKMMKYMMIFFGIMFYKVAAGLCVYFIVSSIWGLAERKLLPKKKPLTSAGETPDTKPAGILQKLKERMESSTPNGQRPGEGSLTPKDRQLQRKRGRSRDREDEIKSNSMLQRLRAWWADVLEQARKK